MTHSVFFHPIARADLFDLYDYIAERAGPGIAGGYLDRIEAFCASLSTFPARGVDRRDIGPGIRTHALARRVLVAYRLTPERVEILRVLMPGAISAPTTFQTERAFFRRASRQFIPAVVISRAAAGRR